jgi:hypothetical protein
MSRSDTRSPDGSLSRRGFLRTTAGTAGVAAALYGGNRANLVGTARADNWQLVKDALTATSGYAYVYDYFMGSDYTDEATTRLANYAHQRFGDMRNYDGYTGGSALHTEVLAGGKEMRLSDEQIMTGIANQIEASDNVGYSKGKVALIEALNNGNDVTVAKDQMNAALNDYYSKIQTAIIDHYVTQIEQVWHMNGRMHAHADITANSDNSTILIKADDSGYLWSGADDGASSPTGNDMTMYSIQTGEVHPQDDIADWSEIYSGGYADFQLLNGEVYSQVPIFADAMMSSDYHMVIAPYYENWTNGSNADTLMDMGSFSSPVGISFFVTDADTTVANLGSTTAGSENNINEIYNNVEYMAAMDSLYTARDRVNADLQGFADDLYAEYQSGDISLAEVVDPITYATEISQENNPDAFREASAAQLGIPSDAAFNTTIEVFTTDGSGNEVSSQFKTELFTSHNPTDADGNVVDWQVGTRYSPSTWTEPLFITYPVDDSGNRDMTQLEKDFKIVGATDQDGNAIDSFGSRQTNVQTADITKLQEDLDKLRDTQDQLLAEQTTSDDGGGGGGSTNDTNPLMQKVYGIPVVGYILGIGGGAYLYSERNSDDDIDHGRRGGGRY